MSAFTQSSAIDGFSSTCYSANDGTPLSSLNAHEENRYVNDGTHSLRGEYESCAISPIESAHENKAPRQLIDQEFLANLPHSVLKELSKNVAKALSIAKQKKLKIFPGSQGKSAIPVDESKAIQHTGDGPGTSEAVLRCERPGCKTTFRRNKDRLRHNRQKHTTTEGFTCPAVDCPMGPGHQFHRVDKLRDHLCGQKISSCEWACVLPGCVETASGRASLLDHLG